MSIRPVILSGGAGTRLWPVSRETFPKQLLPITADLSMLQQTAMRLSGAAFRPALVVGSEDQRFFIKRQLDQCGAAVDAILLEPARRNTAAAAARAAEWVSARGEDEILLLMPSDHVISDDEAFRAAIQKGISHAENGAIVLFGAAPARANTQYGYIEIDREHEPADGVFAIGRFTEKPDAATAADYVESGRFLWNSGIFAPGEYPDRGDARFLPQAWRQSNSGSPMRRSMESLSGQTPRLSRKPRVSRLTTG